MATDLGIRKPRRRSFAEKAVLGVVALIAVGLPTGVFLRDYLANRNVALTRARELAIDGPPCERLTKAQFEAMGLRTPKGTVYEDATFYRQFGHLTCSGLRYGAGWGTQLYPVCQFTSPRALKVVTKKGEWYFAPGADQPVTVAVPHGEVHCVLAANFTIKNLMAR